MNTDWHPVKASSFADTEDVLAFNRCKARGGSDRYCFRLGDNGIGFWGDSTAAGTGPSCALPPDDIIAEWASLNSGKHKLVEVSAHGRTVICTLKDTMPWKRNIKNGAGIDLNPDACDVLGLNPPILTPATWRWKIT